MDFIERLFGMAPDAGNGATEALIVAAVVLALVSLYCWWAPLLHRSS